MDALSQTEVEKLKKAFFDNQNNRKQFSTPLLTDKDIIEIPYDDGFVLAFIIPRASRQMRPIYVGTDPLTGTFRRNNEETIVAIR